MAIKYIVLANSRFELQDSAFFKKIQELANGVEPEVFSDDEDNVLTLSLLDKISSAKDDDQLVFCLMYRAGDQTQSCTAKSIQQLWVELTNKSPANKFVVFADSVPVTEEQPVVDVFTSIRPYFAMADMFFFARELDAQNFTNEVCNPSHPDQAAIERLSRLKGIDELKALEDLCKQSTQVVNDVDMNFWYQEAEIKQVIIGELAANDLKVFQPTTEGLVLNADDSVYVNDDRTFTVCSELSIGQSEIAAKLDLYIFRTALQQILKLTVAASQHTILFPINLSGKRHFCTGVLTVAVDRSNAEQPVLVSDGIRLTVIDTLYDGACIRDVQNFLEPLITKFCEKGAKPKFEANNYKLTPQPDTNSCGVLAAEKIVKLVVECDVDTSLEPISLAKVAVMRGKYSKHIKPIQQRKSKTDLDSPPAKKIDIAALLDKFNAYLTKLTIEELALFKAEALVFLICELRTLQSNADKRKEDLIRLLASKLDAAKTRAQTVVKDHSEEFAFVLTDFSSDLASEKVRIYSNKLKSWFDKHEQPLRADGDSDLLDAIFKPVRDSDGDFEWASKDTDGRLNLVAILERLFDLHLIEVKKPALVTKRAEGSSQIIASDYMQEVVEFVNLNGTDYKYSGTVSADGLASGLGQESSEAFGYFYQGNFVRNRKAGYGIERKRMGTNNQYTEFAGIRDDSGQYNTGSIRCFLGGETTTGYRLILQANLHNGKIEGLATVAFVSVPSFSQVMFFNLEFLDNQIIAITQSPLCSIKEEVLNSLVSAVRDNVSASSFSLSSVPNFDSYLDKLRDQKLGVQQEQEMVSAQGFAFYPSGGLSAARTKPNLTVDTSAVVTPGEEPKSPASAKSGYAIGFGPDI